MGYFPTPEAVFQLVSNWLVSPEQEQWRLLDPCVGKGEVAQLTHLIGGSCHSLGVELSPKRADAAAQVMDEVINAAWRQTRVKRKSVSLLWLNPPYDHDLDDQNNQRLEIEFLRTAAPKLMDGGVLVYVIPQRLLGFEGVAQRLAGHFQNLVVRRFPNGEYERFKQVVVLGVKKPYKTPTKDQVEAIREMAQTTLAPLEESPEAPWPVAIPSAPERARFRRVGIYPREQIACANASGWPEPLWKALEYQEHTPPRPAIKPKKGHVAMMMSSGMMGHMQVEKNGQKMLVKGRTFKEAVTRTEKDEKGNEVYITTYRPKATVGILDTQGVQVIDETEALATFMERYGDALAEQILQRPPLYDLKPPSDVWNYLETLSKDREPLPGQDEPGLLEVQKHVAIAVMRALREHGTAIVQGEMGTGKTTISLAALDSMGSYPALVMCPPHMVDKWRREAREVIPNVQTRELRRIGKTASMDHEVNDPRRFIEDWNAGRLGEKAIAVVSSTAAKLGSGWEGAAATRYTLPHESVNEDGERIRNRNPFRNALVSYKNAREELKDLKQAGASEERLEGQRQVLRTLRGKALDEAIPYPVCPHCGKPQLEGVADNQRITHGFKQFDKKPRVCNRAVQGWARGEGGDILTDDDGPIWIWEPEERGEFGETKPVKGAPMCDASLYQFGSRYRRYPIADYIAEQIPDAFGSLVVDEIHHYKGKSSDRGIAFARLVDSTPMTLGLTGTLYGGKASDIYWLLYRLGVGDIRDNFPYNSARKWVRMYGVIEEREYGSKSGNDDEYGALNATQKRRKVVREQPGVSPGILRYLIGNTVFVSLKDLGVGLPPYKEEVVRFSMSSDLGRQYRRVFATLKNRAVQDHRYLSTWIHWSLNRPNSAFRYEEIIKEHKNDDDEVEREEILLKLPAIRQSVDGETATLAVSDMLDDELLPKEQWLADYAQAEAQAGRKVLVYVRQTGKRDIQNELKAILEQEGLRARILRANTVGTREREQWVERYAPTTDVLIVNPRLVETGLDLVQFATVIFYEISYSLFTMWQAMRRVWRLGQRQPVKVVFTGYHGAMEVQAQALMGKKMKAAQLLYGDEVGGAIVPESGGDFLTELARNALEGKELPSLQAMFAEVQPTTTSALGSPTAKSPRLTMIQLAARLGVTPNGDHKDTSQTNLPLFEWQSTEAKSPDQGTLL
jgi:superfamily II DNA or RNA helicase